MPDALATLRAEVEATREKHRDLWDRGLCNGCDQLVPCDAARLAEIASALIGVIGASSQYVQ